MNRRILGILMVFAFLILSISGILMFLLPYNRVTASVHTVLSLIVLISVILHVLNNRKIIFNYLKGKGANLRLKVFGWVITLGLFAIVLSIINGDGFFNKLYVFGNEIRASKEVSELEDCNFEYLHTGDNLFAIPITIEYKKGKSFRNPIFAIWVEDSLGNYVSTIYISKSITTSVFNNVLKSDGSWSPGIVRRPEALPFWAHKRNIKASDGLLVPLDESADLDGYTGATPTNNFVLSTSLNLEDSVVYKLMLEVNQAFDWNDYFSKDRFPDDTIYSGSGYVGQPALVYCAEISTSDLDRQNHFVMQLIGHSHYSGKNGELFSDISDITSAKNITERIIVSLGK
jgi:hypothetical protein